MKIRTRIWIYSCPFSLKYNSSLMLDLWTCMLPQYWPYNTLTCNCWFGECQKCTVTDMPFFKKSISFLHNHCGGSCARRPAAVNNLRYLQLNLIVRFTPSSGLCAWSVVKTIRSNSPFALSESKSFLMLSVLAGNLVLHKLHIGPGSSFCLFSFLS